MNETPAARKDRLLSAEVGEDLVVYDGTNSYAHTLDPVATSVWRACDGQRTISEIAVIAGIGEEAARTTVTRLEALGLMTSGISRRVILHRAAKVGGAAAAVAAVPVAAVLASSASGKGSDAPRISSAYVPGPAAAGSGTYGSLGQPSGPTSSLR